MFHATYVGILASVNVKVQGGNTPSVNYPLTLTPSYPQGIPENTAASIQVQWGPTWTPPMAPVYTPTAVPGTNNQLYINWSPDDQVIVLMDEVTGA